MRLDDMNTLIRTIHFLDAIYGDVTRHRVAKNISSVSRSTVYRRVNKLAELGFVEFYEARDEKYVRVTKSGRELSNSIKGLL